jgi:Protein of unknown function (DUF2924)
MQKKRRNGSASAKTPVEDDRASARSRSPWITRPLAEYLSETSPHSFDAASAIAVIAYRLHADRLGDLDHATKQVLDRTIAKEAGPTMSSRLASFDQKRTELTPGTVLVREWDRQSQRVMVLADGFAWNGQTYDSLSKVAFAITGTKWNGPRFFGLRDKEDRSAMEARP